MKSIVKVLHASLLNFIVEEVSIRCLQEYFDFLGIEAFDDAIDFRSFDQRFEVEKVFGPHEAFSNIVAKSICQVLY